jgi:ABC-type arginine/histidine transport system permease subunit
VLLGNSLVKKGVVTVDWLYRAVYIGVLFAAPSGFHIIIEMRVWKQNTTFMKQNTTFISCTPLNRQYWLFSTAKD